MFRLDPRGHVLELRREPEETREMFQFLVAMVAVQTGELVEVERRKRRDGMPIVVLADPYTENFCAVVDPRLGDLKPTLVAEMARVLGS